MNEPFELPVNYKGEELLLPAQLVQVGYTHKFRVEVAGQEVFFEPDEEGSYRAIIELEKATKDIPAALLKAIAEGIETVLK